MKSSNNKPRRKREQMIQRNPTNEQWNTGHWYTNNDGEYVTPEYARQRIMQATARLTRWGLYSLEERKVAADRVLDGTYRGMLVAFLIREVRDELIYVRAGIPAKTKGYRN